VTGRLRRHWREYASESLGLGIFMLSACAFGVLLFHPGSDLVRSIPSPLERRALMGLAMGATALVNIHSPWGKRSGSHLNPAVTLTFTRLGKVDPRDAAWYVGAQFAGGIGGTALAAALLPRWIAHPEVNYVVTVPGMAGRLAAFGAEALISALLMLAVLTFAGSERLRHLTGLAAATLIALYITVEAPVSGMSMNPARTLGSALVAREWTGLWIYFTAPLAGMLLGAALHRRVARQAAFCAKLDHDARVPCLFCRFHGGRTPRGNFARRSLILSAHAPTTAASRDGTTNTE
jgi:aquaporin Z